jgi:hypothetical protein
MYALARELAQMSGARQVVWDQGLASASACIASAKPSARELSTGAAGRVALRTVPTQAWPGGDDAVDGGAVDKLGACAVIVQERAQLDHLAVCGAPQLAHPPSTHKTNGG